MRVDPEMREREIHCHNDYRKATGEQKTTLILIYALLISVRLKTRLNVNSNLIKARSRAATREMRCCQSYLVFSIQFKTKMKNEFDRFVSHLLIKV